MRRYHERVQHLSFWSTVTLAALVGCTGSTLTIPPTPIPTPSATPSPTPSPTASPAGHWWAIYTPDGAVTFGPFDTLEACNADLIARYGTLDVDKVCKFLIGR